MNKLSNYRIAFIGRYTEGSTGIIRSIYMGLQELGHTVYEINVGARPKLLSNPHRRMGGHGPIYVSYTALSNELTAFQPDLIICCAGGLTFTNQDLTEVRKLAPLLGITLSDPDVFPTVQTYAAGFDFHTTNSVLALERYRQRGITNTLLMPFAIDSRFFVPRPIDPAYETDVAVIGHARPSRIALSKQLSERFKTTFYGRNWPHASRGPVHGEEWFKAAYSTKMLVNFPSTGAGYTNVKVGVFEAAATGRLLFTRYFDEMTRYFEYDKEIVGFHDDSELLDKIEFYLAHPDQAEKIAKAGQLRCAENHTWARRLADLLAEIMEQP